MNPARLLAHQGGWDELLLVAAPLGIITGLLVFANRRVTAKLNEATKREAATASSPPAAGPAAINPDGTNPDGTNPDGTSRHDA